MTWAEQSPIHPRARLPYRCDITVSFYPKAHVDHEWLTLSDEQVAEFADALRESWRSFPELLYLEPSPS